MAGNGWQRPWRRRLPVVLQNERSSCGLVALEMVSAWHGGDVPPGPAADRYARGATLADIVALADRAGLQSRALRLEPPDLRRLRLPAILHWQMNHFVVLAGCRRRGFVIHDPAAGRRVVGLAEARRRFTGIALELVPAQDFSRSRRHDVHGLRPMIRSFRYLPRYLLLMLGLLRGIQVLGLAPAVATQLLIDQVVLAQDEGWMWRLLGGLALVMATAAALDAWRQSLALLCGTRLAFDSSTSVVRHLFSLPPDYFAARRAGDILARLKSLTPVRLAVTQDLVSAIVQASLIVTTLLVMLLYSPALTAVALAGLLGSLMLTAAALPAQRRFTAEALARRAREDSSLLASLRGMASLRWSGLLPRRFADWQKHHTAATNATARQGRLLVFTAFGRSIVVAAEQLAFLGVGVTAVIEQRATLGVLFAFMTLRGRLAAAAAQLTDVVSRLFVVRAHQERLADITGNAAQKPGRETGVSRRMHGAVEIAGLGFGYGDSTPLFDGFDCSIAAGEHVAIRGPSGCGKSTLLALVSGSLKPRAGRVAIDGVELDLWESQSLRGQIAWVLQDDLLFEGSIAENICGFSEYPDAGRMRAAAQAADVWSTIRALPMRHETRIGDVAGMLSGGEQQRIILARAFYRQPRILLLDEATRSLDPASESRVLDAVEALACTVLHVTHGPAASSRAGRRIDLAASRTSGGVSLRRSE